MTTIMILLAVWPLLAIGVALIIGRGTDIADARELDRTPDYVPAEWADR